ncbi:hypothetical protein EF912_23115 [Streptomyces sp. WAC07061]|uniref:hypothetical protein n=1 Tax=Streptomyces sp. WAC07061 TaxID=2487410 RepID=UPI000F7826DD|nr:hypothetical protein [Streptomyces sp. WAC07061]RSS49889.1 hypothetical protein EF912_23115 [Streptomyces sp. WAC07061]
MRLRRATVAALGAFTLLLAVPNSASAAIGEFRYTYLDANNNAHSAGLFDPASSECLTIPQVADPQHSQPAYSPRNLTAATATVFLTEDCSGDTYFVLRPLVGRGGTTMKFRSVVFS